MDIGVIATRYARALYKGAALQKVEDDVYRDMENLAESYTRVPDLRPTLDNPMLHRESKQRLMETAAGGKVAPVTANFFALVLKEGRESMLQFMANAYLTIYRQAKNVVRGTLTTAVPVTPAIEEKMKGMVEKMTHGNVELDTEVDDELIGGFILDYDTYRMDASVKTKLQNMLTQLKRI